MTEISAISALRDTDTQRQISFHSGLTVNGRNQEKTSQQYAVLLIMCVKRHVCQLC